MPSKAKPGPLSEDLLILELSKTEENFGPYLRALRQARGISMRQMASRVHKTPTYISDIENRNNRPPEKELLDLMINELRLDNYSPSIKNKLYDLAAKERHDVSADIAEYIMSDEKIRNAIRNVQKRPDAEKIWSKFSEMKNNGGKPNG